MHVLFVLGVAVAFGDVVEVLLVGAFAANGLPEVGSVVCYCVFLTHFVLFTLQTWSWHWDWDGCVSAGVGVRITSVG